ncbi:hypothetical protein KIN20_031590 [Parelaphostrongylus tenuis]|uniref:Tyrosine-protein kinase catalytic domain-containing protein n=1 Tax=Parelaphostrongylus tenuis TaxID=148309 RepID=A0AAD5R5C2_PARTN|nr:hypothetical protein KIN20_031590 [Parelaphostrongylus tenuis]
MSKAKIKEMMREARLLQNFKHRNVVRPYGIAVDEQPLYITLELAEDWALTERKLPVRWLAPETISTFTFMLKTDVYSYAMMVYEIFTSGIEAWDGFSNAQVKKLVSCSVFDGQKDFR